MGGFSQGAAMALNLGWDIGGIVAMSGFLFEETKVGQGKCSVLLVHGRNDQQIDLQHALLSYQRILDREGVDHRWISDMGHEINDEAIEVLRLFINKHMG